MFQYGKIHREENEYEYVPKLHYFIVIQLSFAHTLLYSRQTFWGILLFVTNFEYFFAPFVMVFIEQAWNLKLFKIYIQNWYSFTKYILIHGKHRNIKSVGKSNYHSKKQMSFYLGYRGQPGEWKRWTFSKFAVQNCKRLGMISLQPIQPRLPNSTKII